MKISQQFRKVIKEYPRQFWLMFWGMFISSIGLSMIWPFMTIFLRQRLGLSLTAATSLLMIESLVSLVTSLIAGPLADRFGRKWMMAFGLIGASLSYAIIGQANSLTVVTVLMVTLGASLSLFRVGGDTMVADIIEPEKRIDAYSIVRTISNLGVAIGPAVGGFLAAISYSFTFFSAAAGLGFYGLIVTLLLAESMPARTDSNKSSNVAVGGYSEVFRDRLFISISLLFLMATMSSIIIFVLLPVYVKEHYGILEQQSGFFMATNAFMVASLQYAVTRVTKRYNSLYVLVIGALFYAAGSGSIVLGNTFGAFMISMVIMTFGELILSPTTSTLVANLAPAHIRARYMGIYGLSWGLGSGFGPIIGGFLNDCISPQAIWIGAMMLSLCAACGFYLLSLRYKEKVSSLDHGQ